MVYIAYFSYRQQAFSLEQQELVKKNTFLFNNENIPIHNKKDTFLKVPYHAYFLNIDGANINSVVKHIVIFAKNLLILNTLCYGTFICIITQILARYFR
jgi:hypothetical protein